MVSFSFIIIKLIEESDSERFCATKYFIPISPRQKLLLDSIVSVVMIFCVSIEKNEFNLNISRYVKKKQVSEKIDLKQTFQELQEAYDDFITSETKVKELLKGVQLK